MDAIVAMRKEKDQFFKRSPHSPIPPELRSEFKGLSYYPVDAKYRVAATWEAAKGHSHVKIGTSTGEIRDYHTAGAWKFKLDGVEQSLTAYLTHGHEDSVFVPFRDATSGPESYGAGRYLDLPAPSARESEIDFNLAYHPYCAYSESFSCPLPPRENWLTVPIRAGERLPN